MMTRRNEHLREKAIQLRVEHNMTLNEIVERLKLPKTTVYGWIKHIPIPRTVRQTEAQQRGTAAMQAKYAQLRDDAYQQGLDEAPELLKDMRFRDFVVLYMAEGYKKGPNAVSFVNSDPAMIVLANQIITSITAARAWIRWTILSSIMKIRTLMFCVRFGRRSFKSNQDKSRFSVNRTAAN